jgi:hypothetical protein
LGQKPQCGWLRGQLLPALLLNSRRGIPRGKAPSCPWFAAVPGQMAPAATRRPPRMLGEKGSGVFYLSRGHAPGSAGTRRSWRACQPVGLAARATPRGLARLDRRRGRSARLWRGGSRR